MYTITTLFLSFSIFVVFLSCTTSQQLPSNSPVTQVHSHDKTMPYNRHDISIASLSTPYPDQVILNLTEDPLHSVAINWRTDSTIRKGEVRWAKATHGPGFTKSINVLPARTRKFSNQYLSEAKHVSHFHDTKLQDLEMGETYVYKVGYDTIWSEWFQFRMPTNDSLSFIYFGDAQNDVKSMWSRVIRQAHITMPSVDFMLHAGDLINRYNRDSEWYEWFQAGGFLHAQTPSIMTPGNHEYGKGLQLSPQWKAQFNLPRNGPRGLDETCYQINYPLLTIISLDSEQFDESDESMESQKSWLENILKRNKAPWVAVTMHYPVYSTNPKRDNKRLRENLKPIFDKYQVDIVLQGHDHAYGRGMVSNETGGISVQDGESGTMYVVSVSGPKMYEVSDHQWMTRRASGTQLFQIVSLTDNKLSYKAYTAKGDLYDHFDLVKHEDLPNRLIEYPTDMAERFEKE